MILNFINDLSWTVKKHFVESSCDLYKELMKIDGKEKRFLKDDFNGKDKEGDELKTLSVFEASLAKLSEEQLLLFKSEFMNKEDPYWWTDYWSKNTYYRKKHNTINIFLYWMNNLRVS